MRKIPFCRLCTTKWYLSLVSLWYWSCLHYTNVCLICLLLHSLLSWLTHFDYRLLPFFEKFFWHRFPTISFCHTVIHSIENLYDIVGIMTGFLGIASGVWNLQIFVCSTEYPIYTECNICSMQNMTLVVSLYSMLMGMGSGLVPLSSHAANRYFIPNGGR